MGAGCRLRSARRATLIAMLIAGLPGISMAGVFDDDIAREQIGKTQKELAAFRTQTSASLERLEAALKMQLELANQIDTLRSDVARLRGQLEVLANSNENSEKRQRDFYLDLDGRLRKIEGSVVELQNRPALAAAPATPKADPAAETRAYEEALNLFKGTKYKDAQTAFQNFLRDFASSPLAPSAQFWLANTFYAQQNCKSAIDLHNVVVSKYPDSNKAPDSLLAISTCQQEMNDARAARKTLEQLVTTYPQAPAAESARQRLKKK